MNDSVEVHPRRWYGAKSVWIHGVWPWVRRPAKAIANTLLDKETVSRLKSKWIPFDVVYNAEYFANDVDGPATQSAATIAESIVSDLAPVTAIDIGCGTGALLARLQQAGVLVRGLEYARAARQLCAARGLEVRPFNIASDAIADQPKYDVAISMEVGEHLPTAVADRYVELIACLSRTAVFSAAPPGQGGMDHINEQPHDYWIDKFARRGMSLDTPTTMQWRAHWKASGDVQSWYYDNVMVFRAK